VKKQQILPQNVGYGADDRGRDVSWRPNYRETEPLFRRNPDRPLLHGFFDGALCMNIGIPRVFGVIVEVIIAI
jgi:hypothetical protein